MSRDAHGLALREHDRVVSMPGFLSKTPHGGVVISAKGSVVVVQIDGTSIVWRSEGSLWAKVLRECPVCDCVLTLAAWRELENPSRFAYDEESFEQRDCSCGSTLILPTEAIGETP